MEPSFAVAAEEVELEPWPLDPGQIVAGAPEVRKVFQTTSAGT